MALNMSKFNRAKISVNPIVTQVKNCSTVEIAFRNGGKTLLKFIFS